MPLDRFIYRYLLYCTLLYFTLLYFTLLYSTLLYSTLLYFILLYSTLLHSTPNKSIVVLRVVDIQLRATTFNKANGIKQMK